jgi:anti-sigma regulatory factor (Ser/Thr protein kinase)
MNETKPTRLRLSIASDPAELGEVRRQVEAFAHRAGCDEETVTHVMLAVDEALTNIIRHAYGYRDDEQIDLVADVTEGRLRIAIRDYGPRVDPSQIQSRDLSEIRPGGLGVHIMGQCMDSVDYEPADGGGTVLTMWKTIRPGKKCKDIDDARG